VFSFILEKVEKSGIYNFIYNNKEKVMKTIKIDENLHSTIKDYCKKNNLKMGGWIKSILEDHLKNKNMDVINKES